MKSQREGGHLLARVHQTAGRVFARLLKEHGIEEVNPAQGRIMFVLWRGDGISIQELARRTSLGKSTLTSMLDRLERAGLVERRPSRDDRRVIMIHRTEKDRALESDYVRVSQEMIAITYRGFSEREKDLFEQYLRRILENLESVGAGAGNLRSG